MRSSTSLNNKVYHDDHIPYVELAGTIAANTSLQFGSPTNGGRSRKIIGDVLNGTKIKVYGWELHITGTIHEGVEIEFMQRFRGEDLNRLIIDGDIKENVIINNVYDLQVHGKIANGVKIIAGHHIKTGDIGNHVQLNSRVGNIDCGNVGESSLVRAEHGNISCRDIGKKSKVESPHGSVTSHRLAAGAKVHTEEAKSFCDSLRSCGWFSKSKKPKPEKDRTITVAAAPRI